MKIKGINEIEESIITGILKPFLDKYSFYYYGSRVKGDFRKLSDLDILIKGNDSLSFDDYDALKQAFDESDLPFIVNIVDFHSISNDFYNSIENDLVSVF